MGCQDHDDHQGWHRDTPEDEAMEGSWHQITVMVYMTSVTALNGGTQFRRIASSDEGKLHNAARALGTICVQHCLHKIEWR